MHDWTTSFTGVDTRAASADGGGTPDAGNNNDGPRDAGAPVAGVPPAQAEAPPPPAAAPSAPAPAANPAPATAGVGDDEDAKLRGQWPALAAAGKGGAQDPQTAALKQKLAGWVKSERDKVAVNPNLKIRPPTMGKDKTTGKPKVIEPGGFQYGGQRPPEPAGLDVAGNPKRSEINRAIWAEFADREGGASGINAWDTAGLTVGAGFAAKGGALPAVMDAFLKNDPAAREAMEKVGFTCRDREFYAVDPKTGEVLKGNAAIDAIKGDPQVISRLVEVLENPEHAKKFADAEWASIKGAAGAVPENVIKDWDKSTVLLVAHYVHGTGVPWSGWAGIGPNVADLVRACAKHVHQAPPVGGAIVVQAVDAPLLLFSGGGAGRRVVSSPGPLPTDAATVSYEGHVFIEAGNNTYWHLSAG